MDENEKFLKDIGAMPSKGVSKDDIGAGVTIIITALWLAFLISMM